MLSWSKLLPWTTRKKRIWLMIWPRSMWRRKWTWTSSNENVCGILTLYPTRRQNPSETRRTAFDEITTELDREGSRVGSCVCQMGLLLPITSCKKVTRIQNREPSLPTTALFQLMTRRTRRFSYSLGTHSRRWMGQHCQWEEEIYVQQVRVRQEESPSWGAAEGTCRCVGAKSICVKMMWLCSWLMVWVQKLLCLNVDVL
jgi:hypothetical protein